MAKRSLRHAAASDVGLQRHNNEDAWYADAERGIFLVVDGIGGQAAGEKAAEIAVDRVRARLERQTGTAEQRVREAITMANNEILRAARSRPEWQGMACVLTVALLENGSVVVGHVGDSRLYQIHRGDIRKITHDHSPVGEREDRRELSEAEAMRHPRRNEVFRDVGSEERAPGDPDFIEIQQVPFPPDSALLLCSDGLSDQVPSKDIRGAVARHAGNPEAAVEELIDAANRAGGKDNVTVLVVEGETFGAEPATRDVSRPSVFAGRFAMFCYGALLAAAAAFAYQFLHRPEPLPPVHFPTTLSVGAGARFATIAEALAAAQRGDTVSVEPGEYAEQVRLKSGVNLVASRPYEAVLRAAALSRGPAVIAERVSGVSIRGFSMVGDVDRPLTVGAQFFDSGIEASGLEIRGAGVGVEIRGGSVALSASTIRDCAAEGVLVEGDAAAVISHNWVRDNKGAGIAAREGARPVLDGNVLEKNPLELPPQIEKEARERNLLLDVRPARGAPAVPVAPRKQP